MTPITPHTVIHQKANLIHSAIIKPNNRCFYVLKCKYMKLQFDARRVIPICGVQSRMPKWEKKRKKASQEWPQKQLMMLQTIVLLIRHNRVSDLRWRGSSVMTTSLWHEMYDEISFIHEKSCLSMHFSHKYCIIVSCK